MTTGQQWRAERIRTVQTQRKEGQSEEQILRALMREGLTRPTALKLMEDSKYAYEEVKQNE